jgi:hypothetical protein
MKKILVLLAEVELEDYLLNHLALVDLALSPLVVILVILPLLAPLLLP